MISYGGLLVDCCMGLSRLRYGTAVWDLARLRYGTCCMGLSSFTVWDLLLYCMGFWNTVGFCTVLTATQIKLMILLLLLSYVRYFM